MLNIKTVLISSSIVRKLKLNLLEVHKYLPVFCPEMKLLYGCYE